MKIRHFSYACLAIAVVSLGYQLLGADGQDLTAIRLFTSTMLIVSVGFELVRRELARLDRG